MPRPALLALVLCSLRVGAVVDESSFVQRLHRGAKLKQDPPAATVNSRNANELAAEIRPLLAHLAGGPYSAAEVGQVGANMAANLLENGTVLASPSNGAEIGVIDGTTVAYPNYYYMWTRDGGLAMRSLFKAVTSSPDGVEACVVNSSSAVYQQFQSYAELLLQQFSQPDPNTDCPPSLQYCKNISEPKYFVNGSTFDQPWGRPQNDGPAIVALTLVELAKLSLDVHGDVWATEGTSTTTLEVMIKALNFCRFWYMNPSFGPWENRFAQHYWVTALMRRALAKATPLMRRLNQTTNAEYYSMVAGQLTRFVASFWDEEWKMVRARDGDLYDYAPPRCLYTSLNDSNDSAPCSIDTQVLLGSVYAEAEPDSEFPSVFPPYSSQMLSTTTLLLKSMAPYYLVNQLDDEKGLPGVLIGRFPGDNFQGYTENGSATGPEWGNPWFLTTHGLAELLYRTAAAAVDGSLFVTSDSREFLMEAPLLGYPGNKRPTQSGICLSIGDAAGHPGASSQRCLCASALLKAGDGVLERAKYHAEPGLHMPEEIEGHAGHPFPPGKGVSAANLTWSYASVLDALGARKVASRAISMCERK